MNDKLTTKRMRQIAGLDSRAGAPVGNALEQAADHIDLLTDTLRAIEKQATRCRGPQSHADTIRFIIDAAKIHRTMPSTQGPDPYPINGWVLMPVKPTSDMLDSMLAALYAGEDGTIGINPEHAYSELMERAPVYEPSAQPPPSP